MQRIAAARTGRRAHADEALGQEAQLRVGDVRGGPLDLGELDLVRLAVLARAVVAAGHVGAEDRALRRQGAREDGLDRAPDQLRRRRAARAGSSRRRSPGAAPSPRPRSAGSSQGVAVHRGSARPGPCAPGCPGTGTFWYTVSNTCCRLLRLARPGMPPRWAHAPKATTSWAFLRSMWTHSSCSDIRTPPLMKATAMDLSGIASMSLPLEVHGDRPEHDVDGVDDLEDLLLEVDDGFFAPAAGGAPVERDLRFVRHGQLLACQGPSVAQLVRHLVDHVLDPVALAGRDPLEAHARVIDAELGQHPLQEAEPAQRLVVAFLVVAVARVAAADEHAVGALLRGPSARTAGRRGPSTSRGSPGRWARTPGGRCRPGPTRCRCTSCRRTPRCAVRTRWSPGWSWLPCLLAPSAPGRPRSRP